MSHRRKTEKVKIKFLAAILLMTTASCTLAKNDNSDIVDYGYSSLEWSILNSINIPNPPNQMEGQLSLSDISKRFNVGNYCTVSQTIRR